MDFLHSTRYLQQHRYPPISATLPRQGAFTIRRALGRGLVAIGLRLQARPLELPQS